MRSRLVRGILVACILTTLAGTPITSWGNDEVKSEDNIESGTINISDKSGKTLVYNDSKMVIRIENAKYTLDASDITFEFYIENNYPNILNISIQDSQIDGSAITFWETSNDYKAGTLIGSIWYIMLEDLQAANLSDFEELSFTMTGTLNDGTELFRKNIVMERDAFISLADEETTDSESITQTETDDSNILYFSDNSELEKKIKELEEENKNLKKQLEELQESQNISNADKMNNEEPDTAASIPAEIGSNTVSNSSSVIADDSLYEEAVEQLLLILDKVSDPSGLTINKAEYVENTYLGDKVFMFDCSYTNKVGGVDRTKFACIDGILYDEDPARPQGNMAYIQFWDKEDSVKLDVGKLEDMLQ